MHSRRKRERAGATLGSGKPYARKCVRALGAIAAISLSSGVGIPSAQAQTASVEESPSDMARRHYQRAAKLYESGNLAASIVELRRAYELRPSHKILRTIAEVAVEMHDYATAVRSYEQFLKEGSADVDDEVRERAVRQLEELRSLVGFLRIESWPEDGVVTVDSEPVGTTPLSEPWVVNVGRHVVTVERNGFTSSRSVVSIAAGDTVVVRAKLSALPPPVAPARRPPAAEPEDETGDWTWAGFGTAGALATAGTITGLLALRADDRARGRPFVGADPPASVEGDLQSAQRYGLATDLLFGAALGVAAVTVYLTWLTPEGDGARHNGTRVVLGPNHARLEGAF